MKKKNSPWNCWFQAFNTNFDIKRHMYNVTLEVTWCLHALLNDQLAATGLEQPIKTTCKMY